MANGRRKEMQRWSGAKQTFARSFHIDIIIWKRGGEDTYPSNFPEKLSANCVALFSLCNSVNPSSQYYITFAVLFIFFFLRSFLKKKKVPFLLSTFASQTDFLKNEQRERFWKYWQKQHNVVDATPLRYRKMPRDWNPLRATPLSKWLASWL